MGVVDAPQAVLDIGSNSCRLVVYRMDADGATEVLDEVQASLRLVRALEPGGTLAAAAVAHTIAVLADFCAVARRWGVERIQAVATAAVREATNGAALIARIRAAFGIDAVIIDGQREGHLAFLGALYGVPAQDGLLVDLGGGSMQIVQFRHRRSLATWTLPLGALRLSDRYLADDPPTKAQIQALRHYVAESLAEAGVPRLADGETLVGTGGTIRNLARVDRRRQHYPLARVRGYVLTEPAVHDLETLLVARSTRKRTKVGGLHEDRADSIVGGVINVHTLLGAVGASELVATSTGLREGLMLETHGGSLPQPRAVRHTAIVGLAKRFAPWSAATAGRRSALALALLDAVAPQCGEEERETLALAALVLDIGRSVDYYRRYRHTANMLAEADLPGFSHRALALLSATIGALEEVGLKAFRPLLGPEDKPVVARLASVLTLTDAVERRCPAAADGAIRCVARDGEMICSGPVEGGSWLDEPARRFHQATGYHVRLVSEGSEE